MISVKNIFGSASGYIDFYQDERSWTIGLQQEDQKELW